MKKITIGEFQNGIKSICCAQTSSLVEDWTLDNPLWGHCALVSLAAHSIFGGDLLRTTLENTKFSKMRSHYINRLSDGTEIDFTAAQFTNEYPEWLVFEKKSRQYMLFDPTIGKPREIVAR